MFEDISQAITSAAANRQKAAMIHFQILTNADRLEHVSAADFCRKVGIEASWEVEFQKMMNLSRMLREHGFVLQSTE